MHRTSRQNLKRETACGTAIVAACLFLLVAARLKAGDVYVVRFRIIAETGCPGVKEYRDQVFFRNTTSQDLMVRAVSGSNGYQPPSDPLVVPAGGSRSVVIVPLGLGGIFNDWTPVAPYVFMVNKLDVPSGIIVESRGEMIGRGVDAPCFCVGCVGSELFGSFPLPVVRALTPPNVPEFHLDSGLGTVTSVTNVGVYNGGSADATARIEVRAACNDRLLETRTVAVPAATLTYATGFKNTFLSTTCSGFGNAADYSRYVVVTMDQPGFSFVVTRADVPPSALPITSSLSR